MQVQYRFSDSEIANILYYGVMEAFRRNSSVIMISRDNSEDVEVYNISVLDKFTVGKPSYFPST
ncbi:hypothetical protein ACJDU8_07450 [Clostridium sp. WILCCON 0269]|uniref:Uncharacterized protein n=1 Tax=Candidatus Clostridium eludens TaxID=3381663 RepID=A0ABW8SI01_9CLOT